MKILGFHMWRWLGLRHFERVPIRWPRSVQDVRHWNTLISFAILLCSSLSLQAQATYTYEYTGTPFDTELYYAEIFDNPGIGELACSQDITCLNGVVTATVVYSPNNSSGSYTISYTLSAAGVKLGGAGGGLNFGNPVNAQFLIQNGMPTEWDLESSASGFPFIQTCYQIVANGGHSCDGALDYVAILGSNFSLGVSTSPGTWTLVSSQTGGLQITTTSLPSASSGQAYPSTTLMATGGSASGYTWCVQSGSTCVQSGVPLPAGFSLSPAGVLSSTGSPADPADSYSFTVQVTDSAGNLATQLFTLVISPCAMNVTWSAREASASSPTGTGMYAQASSPTGTLQAAAKACGFEGFEWQQTISNNPCTLLPLLTKVLPGTGIFPEVPSDIPSQDLCPDGSITATSASPLSDPPDGGEYNPANPNYVYYNPFPFYYDWATVLEAELFPGSINGCVTPNTERGKPLICFPLVSADDKVLAFYDNPDGGQLPGISASSSPSANSFIGFKTTLVGVSNQANQGNASCGTGSALYCTPLYWWAWNTTFNGTKGGISQLAAGLNPDPTDPGSGTGGITVTSINGVQLPPVVPPNQVATTASGLAYSRVSQTFNGTVTITNISSSAISGPLQIFFTGLTAGVTLANATNNLSGTPYLTVPGVGSLAPGQKATVTVQFKDPSNAPINSTPVIYSGSMN